MQTVHPTVTDRLAMREYARRIGDVNLERACNADLVRLGYRDDTAAPTPASPSVETVVPVDEFERAVPEKPRRGRRPLPRCEHNNIAGRCDVCAKEGDEQHG